MSMKYINQIGVMLSAGLMLAAASCTDYSDYNDVPTVSVNDQQPGANNTLWENISNDQQLTKFAELARKSNFSEVLNSPRFYTLWAPVDDAISETDYQSLLASDSATIVKQFMRQHMTEYNYPVSAALDSMTVISLNAKHHPFTQVSFDGFTYVSDGINLPATNGVMHKINGYSTFRNNLYENIDDLTGCDSIKNYIQQYDVYKIDPNASIIGPLVNGQQTYLDTVLTKSNDVISNIMRAKLEEEDSTYCMLIPNDEAWRTTYEAIKSNYNYIGKLDYMDLDKKTAEAKNINNATMSKADKAAEVADTEQLQDSLTRLNIVNNLVFSNAYERNHPLFADGSFAATDSVYSTAGRYLTNAQSLLDHTQSVNMMSNGLVRIVDAFPYKSWETYNPVIRAREPEKTLKVRKLTTHNIPLDSLAGRDSLFSKVPDMIRQWILPKDSRFFSYIAVDAADIEGTSGVPEFDFALRGVRSTTYNIYVVTVPAQVEDSTALVKPYYLRFYLSWTDASNKQQYNVLPTNKRSTYEITTDNAPEGTKETDTDVLTYVGDPGRVNVLDLGEFTFPACYYGTDAYPSLMMSHTKSYGSNALRNRYDQQMRVAGVFLVPKDCEDYWTNSDNE